METRGLFISDLHLLSRRSVGQLHWEQLLPELQKSDLLILGGDIFDFRWSTHGDLLLSVQAAKEWLQTATEVNRHLRIVYLLGNHDCLPAMKTILQLLAAELPNFCWTEQYLSLDDCVFLHGDVLDAGLDPTALSSYRSNFADKHRERGDLAHRMYDLVVATRMHGIPPKIFHRPARVTKRLSEYLSALELSAEQGIHNVYFGHTHQPLLGLSNNEQYFFNPGSGIRHLPFNPCRFTANIDLDQVVEQLTIEPTKPLRFHS
jgi:UDP-2,3-diacylglucosamine hydrolase